MVVGSAFLRDTSETALTSEWRAQAECIDQAYAHYGLHNGLSRYWHANSVNAQLRSPIHIVAISDSYSSIPLNKNIDWVGARVDSADRMPQFDFIDEYQFDAANLDQTFGTAKARVDCPLSAIRVYAANSGLLGAVYRHSDWMAQETFNAYHRMSLPAAGWAQDPAMIRGDGLQAKGFFPSQTPVLAGALTLTPQPLQAWIDYQLNLSPDAEVHWEAVALDDAGTPLEVLANGSLSMESIQKHQGIPLPAAPAGAKGIGFSISVRGHVDLRVQALGLEVPRSN